MGVALLEELGQTAPADVLGKDVLFIWCSQTVFGFQGVQQTNGVYVVVKTLQRSAYPKIIRGNMEVCAAVRGNFRVENMEATFYRTGNRRRHRERFDVLHILHDLTDKGRIVQSFRVYHFAVYDADCFQIFPYLLGVNVIKGIFLYVRCGIINFHCLGMVVLHFLGSFFQRIIGAIHISGSPVYNIVMVIIEAIHMILYLDLLTVSGKTLNNLITDSVEGNLGKLLVRKGHKLVKIRINKLLLGQSFQCVIFSGIHDDAVNRPVQPEIHQVNADLNGNFLVCNGGVGNIHFSQIGKIRFAVIFFGAECGDQCLGPFQIFINGLLYYRTKGVVIAKYRERTGQVAFHSLHALLPGFKETVIGLCCIHEGLHHGLVDGIDLFRVRKLLLNLRNALPIVNITSGGGPLKTVRGIGKEQHDPSGKLVDLIVRHLIRIAGIQISARGNHIGHPFGNGRPFHVQLSIRGS